MKYKTKEEFLDTVVDNYKDHKEFHQAVEEVVFYMGYSSSKSRIW